MSQFDSPDTDDGYVGGEDDGEGFVVTGRDDYMQRLNGEVFDATFLSKEYAGQPCVSAATMISGREWSVTLSADAAPEHGEGRPEAWVQTAMSPAAARRLAAQLLTAADYAEAKTGWGPETSTAEYEPTALGE
jgi:hypothetical protein